MNWTWTPRETVVHIYFKFLLDCNHRGVMEQLTDHFIIPLYKLIFEEDPPCMSRGEMEVITDIIDWYAAPGGTFLRVFSGEKPLHVLPRYATDKLIIE